MNSPESSKLFFKKKQKSAKGGDFLTLSIFEGSLYNFLYYQEKSAFGRDFLDPEVSKPKDLDIISYTIK